MGRGGGLREERRHTWLFVWGREGPEEGGETCLIVCSAKTQFTYHGIQITIFCVCFRVYFKESFVLFCVILEKE